MRESLNNAISFFYKHRILTLLFVLIIFAAGVWAHFTLDTEAYPEFAPPTVRVITLAPGKGAEEVERLITIPLEKELNAIPGEVNLRSISILGLSVISVIFQDGTPTLQARQQVLERIAQADIPDYARPNLDPDAGATSEIYRYTLESKFFSPMSRKAIQDWQLERAFKQIPGVIDVVSFGGPTKTFQVNIDSKKLVSYQIPLTAVFDAIQNSNGTTGGNYIENNGRAYVVRGLGLLTNVADIERVVVSNTQDGTPVRIKDIAHVDIGPGIRLGQFGKNEDDDAVMGIVLMRRYENPSRVVERLYEKLPEIKASLPDGIKLVKLYDRQELVQHTLDTIFHNVGEGIVLVVAVLIVFLFDLSSGLIASMAIPLSLCIGLFLLSSFHIAANLLSLGAVDFGIIVDGAVVMVENAFARLSQLPQEATHEERSELVLRCAQQVGSPILFAIIIIMASFLPIVTFEGVAGKLFRPLVFTMNLYLVGALIAALFIIPTLIGMILARRKLKHVESPVIKLVHMIYKPTLGWSLNHPRMVILAALCSLGLAAYLGSTVGSEFLPALDEGNIWLRCTVLPTSVSLEEAVKTSKRIRKIIRDKFPEIKTVTSQTGCPDDGTDPNLFSNIETFLDIRPFQEWRPEFHQDKKELIKALNKEISVIPNALFYFSQYIQDNVDEAVAGAKGALAIKIYGPDIDVLQRLGDRITAVVSAVPGLVDVANTQQLGQPQYQVAIDRDEASRYGVNVSDVQYLVETAIGGKVATRLIDGEKRFPVVVRFSKEYRDNIKALDNILIDPPGPMKSVPLSEMGSIKEGNGAATITREMNQRVMYVRINLRGRDLGSAVLEAQKRIAEKVRIPEGYKLKWAGQYEFQQQANQRLMVIVPATFLLIYLILLAAFGSHKNAMLIMCGVPLAALGGISALILTHTYFSISAAVGFIALSGVAVQNGVILISYINTLRQEGLSVKEAAFKGAMDRMRPVLMTATVAMLGLLPAATSNGIGAQSQKPFAIAIIGGLMSATVLTLIVLPAIYTVMERDSRKDADMSKSGQAIMPGLLPFLLAGIAGLSLTGCTALEDGVNAVSAHFKSGQNKQSRESEDSKKAAGRNDSDIVSLNDSQRKDIELQVTQASYGLLHKTVDATGRVGPNAESTTLVSSPSPGRAVKVLAKLGDTVTAGQVMAVIKSDPIGQVQSDLLQNTMQSNADITQQEVELKLAKITYERESRLWKEQVSAKADLQSAENQLEKEEANLQALKAKRTALLTTAQARLTLLGAPPDSAQSVLASRKLDPLVVIRAPRSGLVIDRQINPGELSDGSKALFTLANLGEVWLFADIFERDIPEMTKGDEAVVRIDSLPGKDFPARIIWVGDSVNPSTRTLPVRANVPNKDFHLKPGMFARMRVDVGDMRVLMVPRTAVLEKGDKQLVYVEKSPGTYQMRELTLGAGDPKNIEVLSGLKEGERVVSNGAIAVMGKALKATAGGD